MRFVVVAGLALLVYTHPGAINTWWVVLAVVALWVVHSLIWPWRDCRSCGGSNKHRDPVSGESFHLCDACGRTGRVLRFLPKLSGRNR